ncbi:DUF2510 domain-containing protein [Nocardioides insulae]|uniref:DUF2510 domain-containing protein n=1 Tax=Nocardioides insulae TaxID=394734 RepID=UPI00040AD86A|nr:DUF2510 domain-containing protein [Nocardioides insulae]
MSQPTPPPGWYPDGSGQQRYWNGSAWSDQTRPQPPAQPPLPPSGPTGPPPGSPPQNPYAQQAPHQPSQQPAQQPGNPYAGPSGPPPGVPYGVAGAGYAGPGQPPKGRKGLMIGLIAVGGVAVVAAIAVLVFALAGGGGPGDPEDVADEALSAMADGDLEGVCELMSSEAQEQLFDEIKASDCAGLGAAMDEALGTEALGVSFSDILEDLEIDYEITDSSVDGDTASVDYTQTVEYTGDNQMLASAFESAFESESGSQTLPLVEEDGEWRIGGEVGLLSGF